MNLGRNGHFTDLTIEQWLANEPRPADVTSHFDGCEGCRRAVEMVENMPISIPPFAASIELNDVAKKPRDFSRVRMVIVGAATILGVMLVANIFSEKPTDEIRIKGRSFSTLVYGKSGESVRPLFTGSTVHPGERIGFRVENKAKGFLAIIGVDDSGESYLCFPQGSANAQPIEASEERTLKDAIRLDAKLGKEHIISVFCKTPFSIQELKTKIRETPTTDNLFPTLLEHCEQSEVILEKK